MPGGPVERQQGALLLIIVITLADILVQHAQRPTQPLRQVRHLGIVLAPLRQQGHRVVGRAQDVQAVGNEILMNDGLLGLKTGGGCGSVFRPDPDLDPGPENQNLKNPEQSPHPDPTYSTVGTDKAVKFFHVTQMLSRYFRILLFT